MKYPTLVFLSFFGPALLCVAKEAPAGMKTFNKTCPAPKLCQTVHQDMDACGKGSKKACDEFVTHYKALLPEYDCQRSYDATPTVNYIVPAAWLCGANDRYLEFLSKLKTKSAKKLFGSEALRQTLDGEMAETYREQSLRTK